MLAKEVSLKAAIGPFPGNPFKRTAYLSPLNTVPKKESDERRLILDLSHPTSNSINDGIDKDTYLGDTEKLILPSIDALADRIRNLGPGCKIFKIDLRRGYRQIPCDPKDIRWLGYVFQGKWYFDCTLSMGSRSSVRCCQMVTSAVIFIHTEAGYFAINYLDDLGGAEDEHTAQATFEHLLHILHSMGLKEAPDKMVPPCMVMVFLGIEVNTITLTLSIPLAKWREIRRVLAQWENKKFANLKEVQTLAGLLNFACRCVCSGRVYLSCILNFLRTFKKAKVQRVVDPVHKDIQWWIDFAPLYNRTSLMLDTEWTDLKQWVSSDSCLTGGGVASDSFVIAWKFPKLVLDLKLNINQLECLMLVIAFRAMGSCLNRKKLILKCDNMVTVLAVNTGASKDNFIQSCLRELHVHLALLSCDIKAVYLTTKQNKLSDALSRMFTEQKYRDIVQEELKSKNRSWKEVENEWWGFIFNDLA